MRNAWTKLVLSSLALVECLALAAPAALSKELTIVEDLDLQRYQGQWHEIARLPNWFERKCASDIKAEYQLQPNGTVRVVNSCQTASGKVLKSVGVGKPKGKRRGHLLVTFAPKLLRSIPLVWADYCVVFVDASYTQAVVGDRRRRYLWFLSREKTISESEFKKLEAIALREGFDTQRLIRMSADR